MKLSEAIAMTEEWLDQHTYNYQIYKIKAKRKNWIIRFLEYDPFGNISCDTYFYVPFEERRIYNFAKDDVLDLGRSAYDYDKEMMQWFDEFEKKWRYGDAE